MQFAKLEQWLIPTVIFLMLPESWCHHRKLEQLGK